MDSMGVYYIRVEFSKGIVESGKKYCQKLKA